MSTKDTTAKKYMSNNKRFADLFNNIVFGGRQIISADELVEKDSTELISFFDEAGTKSIKLQKWRDLLKMVTIKSTDEVIMAILGIENQSDVHYAMVIRDMLYDAMSYSKQVEDAAKKHRKLRDTDTSSEFLSGFTKKDKLKPVITLTIYWGMEEWDAPRNLYDMLNTNNTDVLKFVNNYKLNLVIPQELSDFSGFHTELGKLFNIYKYAKDKNAKDKNAMDKLLKNSAYKSVKIETVDMMNTFLGIKIPINSLNKEEAIDMCKAWDEQRAEGREEGRTEGLIEERIHTLLEFNKTPDECINDIIKRYGLSEEDARNYFDKFAVAQV